MSKPSQPVRPVRRARHLMDPDNPRPPAPHGHPMSLAQVQRWVMSVLLTSTVFHLAAGIVVAAYFLDEDRTSTRISLLVVAAVCGMIAMAVGFLVHHRKVANAWLLLGWVPSIVGASLIFS